jgi:hypothetical protein
MKAVFLDIADYKWTFAKSYDPSLTPAELKEARRQDRHACHARSSKRILEALRTNAGIYVVSSQSFTGRSLVVILTSGCHRRNSVNTLHRCKSFRKSEPIPAIRRDLGFSLSDGHSMRLQVDVNNAPSPRPVFSNSAAGDRRDAKERHGLEASHGEVAACRGEYLTCDDNNQS